MRKALLSIVLALSSLSLFAQDDFGVWGKFILSKSVSSKFGVQFIYEHRTKNDAKDLDVALIMPGVTYRPVSWMTLGMIYDYTITPSTPRHIVLPYVTLSKNISQWNLSWREMGQYNVTDDQFFMRNMLMAKYNIPQTILSPFVQVETYLNTNYAYNGHFENPFVNAACSLGIARATNYLGVSAKVSSKVNVETGYIYYYLGSTVPGRHLLNVSCTVRL